MLDPGLDQDQWRSLPFAQLALDLGLKRTGVASGDLSIGIAHPLTVIQADSTDARLTAIGKLVTEWQPVLLVLGLPTHADGSEHDMTRVARNFARKLESRFNLPVFLVDERHTSTEAESELHARGIHGKAILSPWLALGAIPTLVGLWLVYR